MATRIPSRHSTPLRALAPLLAGALLAACRPAAEPPAPEVRPVRTITVDQRDAQGRVALTGNVQAQTEVNLAFRIDGRLVERAVGIGDAIRPGQLVARLDPENEQSALQSAQAQLMGARARLEEARSNYNRLKGLVAERAVSQALFEQAEAVFRSAESAVESAQSQVVLSQNRLSYTRLVSEVDGVVTAQGAEPGEVVGAGRMVVQVAKQGGRDAVFDVPASLKDAAPPNVKVRVALATDPKVATTGRVREVAPRADPVTGTFRVRIALDNAPPTMRLGSTVVGSIELAGGQRIAIPATALVRSDKQTAVWLVDPKTQTVAPRMIEVATFEPDQVVVAGGLAAGDIVVTAGVQALRAGQKVRLAGVPAAAAKSGAAK
ncbi:MAG: efflux RND transporter periplasmic adaptor subunit [Betaproteobacteria bacterium]